MTMRLSILICHIASRAAMLERLVAQLTPQLTSAVEVLIETDAGEIEIGRKRNNLLSKAAGDYLCFVDDDDAVHPSYVATILGELESSPDCVGFKSNRYQDGKLIGDCSYSIRNAGRSDYLSNNCTFRHFVRTPGHITPVRREHAIATGFQSAWCFGEDRDFERRILPLLKTEVFIDAPMYDYLLVTRENRKGETVHPRRWRGERPRINPRRRVAAQ
jgi:glycosyltransferase involved in cell wall biosynthesis